MTPTMQQPPEDCRLYIAEWNEYLKHCQRGHLFFTYGVSPMAKFNRWWQGRRRDLDWRAIPSHVGIIGGDRGAYESLPGRGPTRDWPVDRYLMVGGPRVAIGRLRGSYGEPHVDQAMTALLDAMWTARRRGYDYVSLLTYGIVQQNGKSICSELVTIYANELLRNDPHYRIIADELLLPIDWLGRCENLWEG